jgi:DNA repair photolyase
VGERFRILGQQANSILTPTSGFIREAGFTHSLTPARNCTYGCTYCYVPTMGIYGGLKPEDWRRWGQFTTFKENAGQLVRRQMRREMIVYCSPLVDPYQPAEAGRLLMPGILDAILSNPPRVFVIQTRSPLVLRDLALLRQLKERTELRISFSVTTNRDSVRRLYEPHCAPIEPRLQAIAELERNGITTHATLAPLLPCDPGDLVRMAAAASPRDLIGDPLHVRAVKSHGATTRQQAGRLAARHGHQAWFDPGFQRDLIETMKKEALAAGRRFAVGPEAFGWLAQTCNSELKSRAS